MTGPPGAGPAAEVPDLGRHPRVAVIVAHPDDETLWAGGLLLSHPEWSPFILTLCRGGDPDRAPRFRRVLERLQATGAMADLDDGPDQAVLPSAAVQAAILALLPGRAFDLVLTHGREGEYTRHRRHEECALAVVALCRDRQLQVTRLLHFAYEDGGAAYLPRPRRDADLLVPVAPAIWAGKYAIITGLYGFARSSWEARTTPRIEAFCGSKAPPPA